MPVVECADVAKRHGSVVSTLWNAPFWGVETVCSSVHANHANLPSLLETGEMRGWSRFGVQAESVFVTYSLGWNIVQPSQGGSSSI